VENRVDFQLIFYYILASSLGEVANVGYFDLKEGGIVYEKTLQDSLDRVSQILKESVFLEDFEMTTKKTNCTYCPYVLLCQRGRRWS
ncbi:MAG: PD-(D/E)XK nuclease family protein, partial [Campylobacteraceae bacterium]|nr:PD-(D/E)XK nuclease family protein [Campylobacteraceae bacterium]